MKKFITLLSVFTLSTSVVAGFQDTSSPQLKISKVLQAKKAPDNSHIVLRGYIVKKVGEEKYLFKDASGQIYIEVDDDVWQGLKVFPKEKITIYGKIDKENGRTEIDVKRISK